MLLCREPEVVQNGSWMPPCGHYLVVLHRFPCGLNKLHLQGGLEVYCRPTFLLVVTVDICVCVHDIILTHCLIEDDSLNLRQILL